MNRIKDPEINPHSCKYLFYTKVPKPHFGGKILFSDYLKGIFYMIRETGTHGRMK